jgi:hypothetical protein
MAPVAALLMAAALFAQMQQYSSRSDADPYHERARLAIEAIPLRFGDWDGEEVAIPPAAGRLLRPNALLSRHYQNAERGVWASLVVVHCRDPRDMSGHYPPNCYPGSGWLQSGPARDAACNVNGLNVPLAQYQFSRTERHRIATRVIYNFFVLPSDGLVISMDAVRRATGDYRNRPYGAAQIQIIMDSRTPEAERQLILSDMLHVLSPVIDVLQISEEGTQP